MRCGKGKHNLGKWSEIAAVFRLGDSLHAEFFVAVNSAKPERKAGTGSRDTVVCSPM